MITITYQEARAKAHKEKAMNSAPVRSLRSTIVRNGDLWVRGAFLVAAVISWALH